MDLLPKRPAAKIVIGFIDQANLLSSMEPPIPVIRMTGFASDRKTPPCMLVLYKPFLVEEVASLIFVTLAFPR
jgi:hypothetical protein